MDPKRFDDMVRGLGRAATRRAVLRTLAAGALGGLLGRVRAGGVAAQDEYDEIAGGAGGDGGTGGAGADVTVAVGNGGTAAASASGGTVTIGKTSSGDVDVAVAVGDTAGGGTQARGGEAAVDVAVGDLRSAVDVAAGADAAASASADGGGGNVVEVTLTGVEGGAGGAGGDGGDAVVVVVGPGGCRTDADCADPDADSCIGNACLDGECVPFIVDCIEGAVCCGNGECCPAPPPDVCELVDCPTCQTCDPATGACVAINQGDPCEQGGTCCAGTCCGTACDAEGACPA